VDLCITEKIVTISNGLDGAWVLGTPNNGMLCHSCALSFQVLSIAQARNTLFILSIQLGMPLKTELVLNRTGKPYGE